MVNSRLNVVKPLIRLVNALARHALIGLGSLIEYSAAAVEYLCVKPPHSASCPSLLACQPTISAAHRSMTATLYSLHTGGYFFD